MPPRSYLPNLLTALRVLLVPFVIQAIVSGRHGLALALFAIAAATDVIDGAAARRLAQPSRFGAYFDPIADKCLLSGVFLALAAAHIVPWWFVIVVFTRDLGILLAAAVLLRFTPARQFPPSVWGKASTFVQILTAVVWMLRDFVPSPAIDSAASCLLWISAALTAGSALHYAVRAIRTAAD